MFLGRSHVAFTQQGNKTPACRFIGVDCGFRGLVFGTHSVCRQTGAIGFECFVACGICRLQHGKRAGAFLLRRSAEQQCDVAADIAEKTFHFAHLGCPRNPFADSADLGLERIDRENGKGALNNSERDDEAE
ncbi:hypothetical protein D3C73_526530 [compost metagenome]